MRIIICLLIFINTCSLPLTKDKQKSVTRIKDKHYLPVNCKTSYIFIADLDKNGNEFLVKGKGLDSIKNNYKVVIDSIAIRYPKMKIKKTGIKDSIVNIELNSKYFTQQIGDTYPNLFKAILVYSLTETPTVKAVNLIFEEGDHGGESKVYYREDFSDFILKECN